MESKLEIKSIWEDDHLFEIQVFASNGLFSGMANCYTLRKEMKKLSDFLKGFVFTNGEELDFSTGQNDTHSYFNLNIKQVDNVGHLVARIRIAHICTYSNAAQERNYCELEIPVVAASIDSFARALSKLSESELGKVTAILESPIYQDYGSKVEEGWVKGERGVVVRLKEGEGEQ